jgi:hypothetical protein
MNNDTELNEKILKEILRNDFNYFFLLQKDHTILLDYDKLKDNEAVQATSKLFYFFFFNFFIFF